MQQTDSLKSLALKVLSEAAASTANEKSCPTGAISKETSGTGQELGQTVGQAPTVPARVRGQDAITESAKAETCWHCRGEKSCQCVLCAIAGPFPSAWSKAQCRACLGTGLLTWPEKRQ